MATRPRKPIIITIELSSFRKSGDSGLAYRNALYYIGYRRDELKGPLQSPSPTAKKWDFNNPPSYRQGWELLREAVTPSGSRVVGQVEWHSPPGGRGPWWLAWGPTGVAVTRDITETRRILSSTPGTYVRGGLVFESYQNENGEWQRREKPAWKLDPVEAYDYEVLYRPITRQDVEDLSSHE